MAESGPVCRTRITGAGDGEAQRAPVDLEPETLEAQLAVIQVWGEKGAKAEALFSPAALRVIVEPLAQALKTASSKDDVVFAVIGLHSSLNGLAKSPKVTTGRLFRQDGSLNLIIGQMQQDVNEREDRRLAPFVPGTRRQPANGDWQLKSPAGQDLFSLKRKDWIVFSGAPRPITIPAPDSDKPRSSRDMPAPAEVRSTVERMLILNELKDKGLITDEEYRGKRQQILDGI